MNKPWSSRFQKPLDDKVLAFGASIGFDQRLAKYDIQGSIAHVKMLAHAGVLSADVSRKLQDGLAHLQSSHAAGDLVFSLAHEDIHMNIEHMLHELIGEDAAHLHTGRSRNDQVALDLHLYVREHMASIAEQVADLASALIEQATAHVDTLVPGYTHLQPALPMRFGHQLMSYAQMLLRDIARFEQSYHRANVSPLGSGALAGSPVGVDVFHAAKALGGMDVYENSIDGVCDRDFVVEFLSNASLLMVHLSQLSEQLILYNSAAYDFIDFDDAYCTGSSMMPQKKNPDIPELVRGQSGRVIGALMGMLTMLKGLPLGYNKDLQEDKLALFEVVDMLTMLLPVYTGMIQTMTVKADHMSGALDHGFMNATSLANYLVKQGVPFRQAHGVVGGIVQHCLAHDLSLKEVSLDIFQKFCPAIDADVYEVIEMVAVVEAHCSYQGTARAQLVDQISRAGQQLANLMVLFESDKD